jgi:putative transcription antitermination factor YqgF
MNCLSIDYGSKRIGIAISTDGLIEPLAVVPNDSNFLKYFNQTISEYKIKKVFVGVSEGLFAQKTLEFVEFIKKNISLPVETVEESVSTIEAQSIFKANKKHQKDYNNKIDAIAAAVILQRVIG